MSKVMYLLHYVGDGGTEKYVLSLIHAQLPDQCVFVYSSPGPFLDKFQQLPINTYQIRMRHPMDMKAALDIKKIAERENVEIIHTQFLRENYIATFTKLFGLKAKIIWTYHVDVDMSLVLKLLNRFFTSFNHSVISVSSFMKKQLLKKGVAKKKIETIYNGISDPYKGIPSKKNQTKQIAVIGRLSEEKGHAFLLESLSRLSTLHPTFSWHCNIIGTGPLEERLREYAHQLQLADNITFKGFKENIMKEYEENDVVVIPSQQESLSFVAIEALSLKKPVIATDTGGLPEVIKHNRNGILVNYGDVENLARSIFQVLENEEQTNILVEQGRRDYLETFHLETMINKTFALYSEEQNGNKRKLMGFSKSYQSTPSRK